MKHAFFRKIRAAGIAVVLVCVSWSCSHDDIGTDTDRPEGNSPTITLTVSVPSMDAALSRALGEQDENYLSTIDVLVFRVNGSSETFHYLAHGTDISTNGAQRTFKVVLRTSDDGNDRHRFVVVTNLRNEVDAAVALFNSTTTKDQALETIQFPSSSKWNTVSSSDFTPLPMWGESANTHVVTRTLQSSQIGTIKLLRAIARIDVGLNFAFADDTPIGLGNVFKISDVKVYNTMNSGLAIPYPSTINSSSVATAPSIPYGAVKAATPLSYTRNPADFGMIREIYIAEAKNTTAGLANNKMTCLVIGGYYAESAAKTWYRIDFYERTSTPSATQSRLDILRNHRYKVNITSVDGPGYATPEIALNSAPVNMQTDIIVWNEGDMSDIVFDGQYYLKVNMDSVFLYREGRPRYIKVQTNHPNGWGTASSDTWIDYDPHFAPADISCDMGFGGSEYNAAPPAADFRRGYVTIKAGKLQKKILVHQTSEPELTIDAEPTSLTFRKTGSNPKVITVTTYPVSTPRFFGANGNLVWTAPGTATGLPADGLTQTTYTIRPPVNNTGHVLSSQITVSVYGADGRRASKNIDVLQLASDLLFSYELTNPYPAVGGTGLTFKVTSEAAWNILSTLPAGIVTISNMQHAPATDEVVRFDLTPNPTFAQRSIALNVTSSHPDFTAQDITVTQNFAVPAIETQPSGSYDFAFSTAPLALLLKSNSNWQVKTISGSYYPTLDVPQNTTINMGASPTVSKSKTVMITPYNFALKVNEAGTITPPAGTRVSTLFRFTSVDHAPASATTVDLTTSATVPNLYRTPEFSQAAGYVIPRGGTTIAASLWANMPWFLHNSFNAKADVGTGNFAKRSTSLTVPANNSWTARNVTFTIISGVAGDHAQRTYQQKGYEIIGVDTNLPTAPDPIPASGGTYKFGFYGDFPNIEIRVVINNNTSSPAWSGTLPAGTGGTIPIWIPENTTTSTRNVKVQANVNGEWKTYVDLTQKEAPYYRSDNGQVGWSTETWATGVPYNNTTLMIDVINFCPNSKWGGYEDWRLPTADELGNTYFGIGRSPYGYDAKNQWAANRAAFPYNMGLNDNMTSSRSFCAMVLGGASMTSCYFVGVVNTTYAGGSDDLGTGDGLIRYAEQNPMTTLFKDAKIPAAYGNKRFIRCVRNL